MKVKNLFILSSFIILSKVFSINIEKEGTIYPISIITENNQQILIATIYNGISRKVLFFNIDTREEKILESKEIEKALIRDIITLNNSETIIYGQVIKGYEKFDGFIAKLKDFEIEKVVHYKQKGSETTDIVKCIGDSRIYCLVYGKNSEIIEINKDLKIVKSLKISKKFQPTNMGIFKDKLFIIGREHNSNGDSIVITEINNKENSYKYFFKNITIYPFAAIYDENSYYIIVLTKPKGEYNNKGKNILLITDLKAYNILETPEVIGLLKTENKILYFIKRDNNIEIIDNQTKKIIEKIEIDNGYDSIKIINGKKRYIIFHKYKDSFTKIGIKSLYLK